MVRDAWGKAVRDPLTWLLFVPTIALTIAWEPVRSIGLAWYWEALIFVGGFTAVALLLSWPMGVFLRRHARQGAGAAD